LNQPGGFGNQNPATDFSDDGLAMIRFLFRFLGLLFLALAFIFLVYDGNRSIADQTLHLTKFEEIWNALYAQTPQEVLRPLINRSYAGWLWDPVILPILSAPIAVILAVVGAILIVLGRKKKPLIGYARD
jgi:ABC-type phosphate transport system permease subunit